MITLEQMNDIIDIISRFLGIFYLITSFLATLLPKKWNLTRSLARFSADMRNISIQPPPITENKKEENNGIS